MTKFALLLVDVQEDYLQAPSLIPDRSTVVDQIERMLGSARAHQIPVAHLRTLTGAAGENAMPHRREHPFCVDGTFGASVPDQLAEQPGELVAVKQYFSGFDAPELERWLRLHQVESIVLVGLFSYACVRQTALDAYQRGFEVSIVVDAVASPDEAHAESTLQWLGSRGATLETGADLRARFAAAGAETLTSAAAELDELVARAGQAQREWSASEPQRRSAALNKWADVLTARSEELAQAISREVRKPLGLARDEVARSVAHIRSATALVQQGLLAPELIADGVTVSRLPLGVIGLLMPWNNPLALPVSTLAAALVTGNAVVFKPAPQAQHCATLILQTLAEAGIPPGLVVLMEGGAEAGMRLVRHPQIDAIAVTGSIRTGQKIAAECAVQLKPVRAELGGNNAAIVLADANLDLVIPDLVRSAFAYSGQRCTALRRFVVEEPILHEFTTKMAAAIGALELKAPDEPDAFVGPLISAQAADQVVAQIRTAVAQGCTLLAGGDRTNIAGQAAVQPALLQSNEVQNDIVQRETFGPVAVIQPARDLLHATELANAVEQGLLLAVATTSDASFERICRLARVGMIQRGVSPLPVHADAPFGGWKASGLGGAEHGKWDLDFFTRPQVSYQPTE
jgi:aldehyde dehydrogenase (NAD+)